MEDFKSDLITKDLPETDPRFPGLRFIPGNPSLKKTDPGSKDRIVTDDDYAFDIFQPVPDPKRLTEGRQVKIHPIEPFTEYTKKCAVFDLEWIGCDGGPAKGDSSDVIVAIGLEINGKFDLACSKDRTEKELLEWFFKVLKARKPHTLGGHAIYGFFRNGKEVPVDLGMIADRCAFHKIKCPWKRKTGDFSRHIWQNAKENGMSIESPAWECKEYQLIDTHPQVAIWDSMYSKLSGLGLKTAVEEMGLLGDNEKNLAIGSEIYRYWADGDVDTIKLYLKQDLVYTRLLWDKLIPTVYFQRMYYPEMNLQRITTTGTGSWWNQYLRSLYGGQKTPGFKTASYQGALTFYYAGIWENCVKIDFGGMYPNCDKWLQLHPQKDKDMMVPKLIDFGLKYRKQLKKSLKETQDINYFYQEQTVKKLLNSVYGLYNTIGLDFNDPYVGAMITWACRQLSRFVIQTCIDVGCKVVAIDTDGLIILNESIPKHQMNDYYKGLEKYINDLLPGNNYVEYEADFDFCWFPPVSGSNKEIEREQQKFEEKVGFIKNNPLDGYKVGLSKNYITITRDKEGKLSIGKKGIFKKRNRSWLDKVFTEKFLILQFEKGLEEANNYYYQTRAEIECGDFPVKLLQKTITVASNWKQFPLWGFPVGQKATFHYIIDEENMTTKTGKRKKNLEFKAVADVNIPYSPEYYLDAIDTIYKSLTFS